MLTVAFTVMRALATTRTWFEGRFDSERGASAVEYALLVGLIAAVIAGAVLILGNDIKGVFTQTSSCVSSATAANCPG